MVTDSTHFFSTSERKQYILPYFLFLPDDHNWSFDSREKRHFKKLELRATITRVNARRQKKM